MTDNAPCWKCDGWGQVGIEDCGICDGTGYQDQRPRLSCDRCKRLTLLDDMHVSPDEDGNRTVCALCLKELDTRSTT